MAAHVSTFNALDNGVDDGAQHSHSIPSSPVSPTTTLNDGREFCLSPTSTFRSTFSSESTSSAYHIYHRKEIHRTISPIIDPSRERLWGPTCRETKENRRKRKAEKAAALAKAAAPEKPNANHSSTQTSTTLKSESSPSNHADIKASDGGEFFFNTPYLSFHLPPSVLFSGTNCYTGMPLVLIHNSAFWKKWKLQLGPSISSDGVIDPRGVVSWRHNGGSKADIKADRHKLKGYKVRTWRLWGENGKEYFYKVNAARKAGVKGDPDAIDEEGEKEKGPARAEEVVYLRWESPLSRHTRRYHFRYKGIDFFWKGTSSVKEHRVFGWGVRWNHLKLVAMVPATLNEEKDRQNNGGRKGKVEMAEICLAKYTSSVAAKKSGKLELFDEPIWGLIVAYVPEAWAQVEAEMDVGEKEEEDETADNPANEVETKSNPEVVEADEEGEAKREKLDLRLSDDYEKRRIAAMKKTHLYQIIVATAMCMIQGEKEKRDVIKAIILELVSQGAGGGGP